MGVLFDMILSLKQTRNKLKMLKSILATVFILLSGNTMADCNTYYDKVKNR